MTAIDEFFVKIEEVDTIVFIANSKVFVITNASKNDLKTFPMKAYFSLLGRMSTRFVTGSPYQEPFMPVIYLHRDVSFRMFSNRMFNVCSSWTQTKLEPPLFWRIMCRKYDSIFFSKKKLCKKNVELDMKVIIAKPAALRHHGTYSNTDESF